MGRTIEPCGFLPRIGRGILGKHTAPAADPAAALVLGGGMNGVEIHRGWTAGAIGRVVELHGAYYHAHWGFGAFFEAKVARELAEFIGRYDEARDGIWRAEVDGRVEGSITVDGLHAERYGAHLRWFIVSDALRGRGAGRRLMDAALDFCRGNGYPGIHLWTFKGLHAARHLYEQAGFALVEERRGAQWGMEVAEQRFELTLDGKIPNGGSRS